MTSVFNVLGQCETISKQQMFQNVSLILSWVSTHKWVSAQGCPSRQLDTGFFDKNKELLARAQQEASVAEERACTPQLDVSAAKAEVPILREQSAGEHDLKPDTQQASARLDGTTAFPLRTVPASSTSGSFV